MKKYPATKKSSSKVKDNNIKTVKSVASEVNNRNVFLITSAIIVLFVLICYSNLRNNNFLNWDDNLYVTENSDITGLESENIKAFFTKKYVSNYIPVTMISYALDYKIGKLNPTVYTATNLLIHTTNSLLVFWLILLLLKCKPETGSVSGFSGKTIYLIAFITALLFAVHPMQVESVAWISERKNTLCALFFLLSLICYFKYVMQGKMLFFIFSLLLFIISLLSKGVAVSLSLCVVLIDYYKGRNLLSGKVMLEKIPFFILSLLFGMIAFYSQHEENVLVGDINYPVYEQLAFAAYGFVSYLIKLLVPFNLSAYYSYPEHASVIHYLCLFLVLVFVMLIVLFRKRCSKLIVFAVLFYVLNLLFLIQIIPVGNALMADRYIYISSIGYFLLVSIVLDRFIRSRNLIYAVIIGYALIIAYTGHQQVKIWNNSLVFWDDVISHDEHIPRAWNNRGVVKKDKGDNEGALADFNQAISNMPEFPDAYNNQGIALFNLGRVQEALASFTSAIELDSVYPDALCNRGIVRSGTGDLTAALADFNKTIQVDSTYLKAYISRAEVKVKLNDLAGAISDCDHVISVNNTIAEAWSVKAFACYNQARYKEAIQFYSRAIDLAPQNMNNFHNRGASSFYSGDYPAAIQDMNVVLSNIPDQGVSYYIRGMAYANSGSASQACADLQMSINKGFVSAQGDFAKFCQ